jgi:HEAT repeat protein
MFTPEDIKAQKHFIMGALVVGLILFAINYMTGFFTGMHLHNEESMAIEHGADSSLYQQMVSELIEDLHSEIAWKRRLAAVELGHLGGGAQRAVPELRTLLKDAQPEVRAAATLALARIGYFSGEMIDPLREMLRGDDDQDKYLAAKVLGQIGPAARDTAPLLRQELQTPQADVKRAVSEALEKIETGRGP